jgi:hypothetical protein
MKKWMYIAAGALVVIAAFLIFSLSHLGPIIKAAVNSEGPRITNTYVHLDSVGVSLLSGEANLKGLLVGNPQGFKAPDAVKVGSVYVNVDEKSLTGPVIVINQIEVKGPEITYERLKNTDNFQSILSNVRQMTGAAQESPSKTGRDSQSGKKLLIRDFVVKDGKVALFITAGRSVTADLPEIHLQNIGGQSKGLAPARAAQEMLAAVYKRIQSPDVLGALSSQLQKLNLHVEGLDVKAWSDKLNREAGGLAGRLKGLLGDK